MGLSSSHYESQTSITQYVVHLREVRSILDENIDY